MQGAYPSVPHDSWSIYGGRTLPLHAAFFNLSIAFALQTLWFGCIISCGQCLILDRSVQDISICAVWDCNQGQSGP